MKRVSARCKCKIVLSEIFLLSPVKFSLCFSTHHVDIFRRKMAPHHAGVGDELLVAAGDFGRYQAILCPILAIYVVISSSINATFLMLLIEPAHNCTQGGVRYALMLVCGNIPVFTVLPIPATY